MNRITGPCVDITFQNKSPQKESSSAGRRFCFSLEVWKGDRVFIKITLTRQSELCKSHNNDRFFFYQNKQTKSPETAGPRKMNKPMG